MWLTQMTEFPIRIIKLVETFPFPELIKRSLGVTFDEWGGNFGTLNYNMPELVMLLLRLVV